MSCSVGLQTGLRRGRKKIRRAKRTDERETEEFGGLSDRGDTRRFVRARREPVRRLLLSLRDRPMPTEDIEVKICR